jgi:MFS family permease
MLHRSWVTYFFKTKFDMRDGTLGTLFFATAWIQAASMLVASSIAKRIGNVKTMAFTHLPSAIALAFIPLPNSLPVAAALLIIRSSMQSMDVAPRSAFLSAVVLPNERTAVMGTINMVKTGSQSLGPLITGILASKNLFGLAFILAGGLKVIYDLFILGVFAGHKPREEESANENVTASG